VTKKMGYHRELEAAIQSMQAMRRRGIRILPGGDYGFAWTPHGTNAKDLENFVKFVGMSPMEALLSATAWGGPMMDGQQLGYIRGGCLPTSCSSTATRCRHHVLQDQGAHPGGDEGRRVPPRTDGPRARRAGPPHWAHEAEGMATLSPTCASSTAPPPVRGSVLVQNSHIRQVGAARRHFARAP
jgi:hypothetical protein